MISTRRLKIHAPHHQQRSCVDERALRHRIITFRRRFRVVPVYRWDTINTIQIYSYSFLRHFRRGKNWPTITFGRVRMCDHTTTKNPEIL